ncbi:carbohydrate binding domain-containing protein [Oceanicoccus sp. KOV_DT_Chl]|uniref:carbohydrate binding domain-containing protein n=1 Tax=Oceanicoccus sp. KOV_DT_Chl TaxID=1904639 RepID=UPI000C7AE0B8|nr:carbohydrate binding domain-containing protein [Oceanicoccus sp. KOV_DT_Chl]
MKFLSLRKWLLVFSLLVFVSSVIAQEDALYASDFEEEAFLGGAIGWKDNSSWADVDVEYERDVGRNGKGFSQKIICSRYGSGAVQFVRAGIDLEEGKTYKITLWLRGDMQSSVDLLLRKRGKPYTKYASTGFKITKQWQEYSLVVNPREEIDDAYIMLRFSGVGALWVDDVLIEKAISTPPQALKNSKENLVSNGSFEVGLDRWGIRVRESDKYRSEMALDFLDLTAQVSKSAKKGERALLLDLPNKARFILTSSYFQAFPGQQYQLSLWAKTDKPKGIRLGINSGYIKQAEGVYENFRIDTKWKKIKFEVVLKPAQKNAYYIIVEGNGAGQIWIDDVQFKLVKSKEELEPKLAEIGFSQKADDQSIYQLGDGINRRLMVAGYRKHTPFRLSIKSINYHGEQKILHESMVVDRSENPITVSIPSSEPGYVRLVAELFEGDKKIDQSETALVIVRPRLLAPDQSSSFGGHIRFSPSRFKQAAAMGVGWLRMHPPMGTKWLVVEPKKGVFSFHDDAINLAVDSGFNILGSLEATPKWASTAPDSDRRYTSYPPSNMDDWENYVYKTVKYYKGKINYWEVWNEPDSHGFLRLPKNTFGQSKAEVYIELLSRAYRAAKAANPDAVIVGGSATGKPPTLWLEDIFKLGALQYMDIVSFHFYSEGRPGGVLTPGIADYAHDIRQLIAQYGKGKSLQIWETESGVMYPRTEYENILEVSPSVTLNGTEISAYLVRNHIMLMASGVSKWFYYSMMTHNRVDRREATAFFEWDNSPRPAVAAYANLSWMLEGAKFQKDYKIADNIKVVEFKNAEAKKQVSVLWLDDWLTDKKQSFVFEMPATAVKMTLYDITGREITHTTGSIEYIVGVAPLFLVISYN